MTTIYDLLEVEESASKEEIEKSYHNLLLEYQINPILSEKENQENEMILNKLKIAYEILMNDEKRAKYDKDLANKRAEELLKNVSTTQDSNFKDSNVEKKSENIGNVKRDYNEQNNKTQENINLENGKEELDVELSKKEKEEIVKAAKKEFKRNLKKAKKVEEEYNQAYNKVYNDYLRKLGYNVKEPLTLKRVMNVVIFFIVTILVCFLAWKIPFTNKILVNIYEENYIIKSFVDIIITIFKSLFNI